jgi:Holliday junction resolvase
MTGQDRERELAKALDEAGYSVMRSPASGSVDRDQPDLLYAEPGERVALEMKYTGESTAYYAEEEVEALTRFATDFGAVPLLCVRWKQDTTFYTGTLAHARRTPEGNYALDQDMELDTVL